MKQHVKIEFDVLITPTEVDNFKRDLLAELCEFTQDTEDTIKIEMETV